MQFPIAIGLHRSRILERAFFLLLIVLLAVAGKILRSTAEIGLFFLAFSWLLLDARRRLRLSLSLLRLESDGRIGIRSAEGEDFIPARVLPGATVHPCLTVFRLETEAGQRYSVLVLPDSCRREEFRRLRVFLRWRADFSAFSAV